MEHNHTKISNIKLTINGSRLLVRGLYIYIFFFFFLYLVFIIQLWVLFYLCLGSPQVAKHHLHLHIVTFYFK